MEWGKRKQKEKYFRQKLPWIQSSRLANGCIASKSVKLRIFFGSPTLLCSGEAWACLLTIDWSLHIEQSPFSLSIQYTWTPSCGWFLTLGKLSLFELCPFLFLFSRCHLGIWVNEDPHCIYRSWGRELSASRSSGPLLWRVASAPDWSHTSFWGNVLPGPAT